MIRRRGLTLLEVLIAAAIMAMLAATVAPLISRSMRLLSQAANEPPIDVGDLATVADVFLAKPEAFGHENIKLHAISQMHLNWPGDEELANVLLFNVPITARALRESDPQTDHLWLVFECAGVSVARWVHVPPPEDTGP